MKRKLALLMAFMMAATLVPATPEVHAVSKNSIQKVLTLADDSETTTMNSMTARYTFINLEGDTPTNQIEGTFELHLPDGVEWLYSKDVDQNTSPNIKDAKVKKLTDTILEVTPEGNPKTIQVPLYVKLNGVSEGAVKVKVVPNNSTVSNTEHTFATVGSGSIQSSVEKKVKIARTGTTTVTLMLKENSPGAFKSGNKITLRLPKDFSWGAKDLEEKVDGKTRKITTVTNGSIEKSEGRELVLVPDAKDEQQTMYVTIPIFPSRNASYGDVDVTFEGADINPSSLVVAEYVGYGVSVKAEKVLDVIAGKDIDGKYKAKLTIEEPVASSLSGSRYMEFKFVDEKGKEVKASLQHGQTLRLSEKSGDATLEIDSESIKSKGAVANTKAYKAVTMDKDGKTVRANSFDLYVRKQSDKSKAKYELEVPFVVASDFTGKLYLQVKGAGVEEQSVQIADVKAPVTFEVAKPLPQVKIGLQKQAASNIVIKEVEAGALQDSVDGSSTVDYTLVPEEKFEMKFKSVDYEKEGDLGIDKVDTRDGDRELFVRVDRKSTKASSITLKGITVTLDRTVPYGEIRLDGNFGAVGKRHDLTNKVKTFEYLTTVTPVSDDKRITTVFKIGEKAYTEVVGNVKEEKTADVAPFIKDNRTMLPVRYVANAIGAVVNYDPNTRVATFTKNQVVVSINIDKDVMYANGSPVKLDAKPANVEGRIFLPIANIAQAFGLKHGETIIWNQEEKTVTILPQDATKEEIMAAKEGKVAENATTKEETKTEEKK